MYIIECYVENFGKLHKYTYKAERGLNVICEGNGSGKTTLAAFIRAMFYGMPATRTRKQLDDAERRKYKPWQGGLWGGSLCFETGNKKYRIERTFSDRDSQDTYRLLDMETGLVSYDYDKNIGDKIFGIDRDGFSSSIYIAGNNLKVLLNDSLSAKIGDDSIDTDDLSNYENAVEKLNAFYKKFGKNGKPHVWKELEETRTKFQMKKEKYEALEMVTRVPEKETYPQWKMSAKEIERLEELDDFFSAGVPEDGHSVLNGRLMNECYKTDRKKSNFKIENNIVIGCLVCTVIALLCFMAVNNKNLSVYGAAIIVCIMIFVLFLMFERNKKRVVRIEEEEKVKEKTQDMMRLDQMKLEYKYLSQKENDYRKAVEQLRQKEKQHAQDIYYKERLNLGSELHDLEMKIIELEQRYNEANEKMELVDKTKHILEKSHEKMMAGYLHGIKKHFKKYMSMFDSQLSDKLMLDIEFSVGVEENGITRELDYFSQGYKDVIRLCQRLALMESLFQKEKPFIILDDPFINMDDEMLGRAKRALDMLGEHMQIIYFTCSWMREPEE